MLITTALLGAAKIACGIIAARTVGKGINAIGERIIPYKTSKAYKQAEHTASRQKELEEMREAFQAKLQAQNIHAQAQLALFNRHSSMLLAEKNAYTSLRHTLVKDAIRNFPLNISPLVLLENNGIDISFLLGKNQAEQANDSLHEILSSINSPKPLNVFITPMYVDARVGGKEILAAQVFDAVYSSLETVFVNEYSRNSERPVIFYSAAWNKNVRGGLHAADELYYFLKEMPTVVVEPRFDGKTVKLMFSCWGIGYSSQIHSRQELPIPLDLNSMLALTAYNRSMKALETFGNVENDHKVVKEQKIMAEHNVEIFEQLNLANRIEKRLKELSEFGKSIELDELGDYSKLMYISPNDISTIADTITATTGMMISAISDTHHLLANDIEPQFPFIYKKYFADYANEHLLKQFGEMYERTYLRLSQEFPEDAPLRLMQKEKVMKLLGNGETMKHEREITIHDSLIQKCLQLGANPKLASNWETTQLIDFYIDNFDGDERFRKSVTPFLSPAQNSSLNSKLLSFD